MYVVRTFSHFFYDLLLIDKNKEWWEHYFSSNSNQNMDYFSADPRRKLTALAIFLLKSKAKILLGY